MRLVPFEEFCSESFSRIWKGLLRSMPHYDIGHTHEWVRCWWETYRAHGVWKKKWFLLAWEGFGIAAVEAMGFSKPVIASDVGGLRDIVEHGVTGLRIAYGDTAGLARAIVQILTDVNRREAMGASGRRRAVDLFSRTAFARNVCGLYASLGGAAPPASQREDAACRSVSPRMATPRRSHDG